MSTRSGSGGGVAVRWEAIDALLPQTQCTRCGEPDCASYARAIASNGAPINRCPPGGAEGLRRLAQLTRQAPEGLDPAHGTEGPRRLAVIDEAWCIGCTLCIKACPMDCILGAPKRMHTVVEADCTGCELCLPACPVDCISLVNASGDRTGWNAWSPAQAVRAKDRYAFHQWRVKRDGEENEARLARKAENKLTDLVQHVHFSNDEDLNRKRAVVQAALERAHSRRATRESP